MDELLAKYMMGEATAAEREFVVHWAKESEYNKKYFADFQLIWETAKTLKTESNLNVEASWTEFKQLRDNKDDLLAVNTRPQLGSVKPLYGFTRWIKIAAIWIAVVGIATSLYTFLHGEPELLTLQSYNSVKTDTLSDGSLITLNKNSIIRYPAKFTGNFRAIKLVNGEAFFSIAHDRSKPFVVYLNNAVVKVVGTSFNIKNSKTKAEIIVETGIVEVIRNKVVIRLRPAEKLAIDDASGSVLKGLSKDNFYNYYRTKEFVANKTPLWRVIEVLNEVYKVDIRIANRELANRTLTTTLSIGELDSNLDLIANTFKVHIVRESGEIIIQP